MQWQTTHCISLRRKLLWQCCPHQGMLGDLLWSSETDDDDDDDDDDEDVNTVYAWKLI